MMIDWIIGKKQPDDRQLFLWNMIGSGIYALSSMVLTYLTIRVVGADDGGIYAIICNRTYVSSDVHLYCVL